MKEYDTYPKLSPEEVARKVRYGKWVKTLPGQLTNDICIDRDVGAFADNYGNVIMSLPAEPMSIKELISFFESHFEFEGM